MNTRLSVSLALFLVFVASACPSPPPPPPLLDVAARVDVVEGRSTTVAFTADADATVRIENASALGVVHAADTVSVTAPIGALDASFTVVAESDAGTTKRTVEVVVTPLAFERLQWNDANGPRAREHGAMFIQQDGATVFLLSGGGYPNFPTQEVIDDAWQLDTATGTWSPWELTGDVPPPAGSRRTAQVGNIGYLFGGYGGDRVGNADLFQIDLATGVSRRLPASGISPPVRALHGFAVDPVSSLLIVYGGFFEDATSRDILGDTWTGVVNADSVTWTAVTGPAPPARYGMFTGLDVVEGGASRFVVFSGAGFPTQADPINAFNDAWVLELNEAPAWRALANTDAPRGRRNGCGVLDPITHSLFVFGGTADGQTSQPGMFALDLATEGWTKLERQGEPPVRSSSFGAAWPGGGVVCAMGNDAVTFQDLFWLQ